MSQEATLVRRRIKVTALTASRHDPSRRFRVSQFVAPLARLGIDLTDYYPRISKYTPAPVPQLGFVWTAGKLLARLPGVVAGRGSDITLLQRELVPGRRTFEKLAGRRLLFDVDDAVWLGQHSDSIKRIIEGCRGVIAGNEFLADYFRRLGARVWVVPTSVDTEVWKPAPKRGSNEWVVGWSGTSSNLKYLYALEEPLADFLTRRPDAKLVVVSDREPRFEKIPDECWRFERWSPEQEVRQVQQMDTGLMPLAATDWERGKCGCKMLTYMAVGAATIASPVGVGGEILRQSEVGCAAHTQDDWYNALTRLYDDRELTCHLGAAGRTFLEERYSVSRSAATLADIFKQVADED
ncbi:MAG TPA: glycosyltransferase family 4 protein [Pyrinomonadaceae bacterium]|jgi:glycosyltransferase involved in cell wall biosynthesis